MNLSIRNFFQKMNFKTESECYLYDIIYNGWKENNGNTVAKLDILVRVKYKSRNVISEG